MTNGQMKKTVILISLIVFCIVCKDKIEKPKTVGSWDIAGFDALPLYIKIIHLPRYGPVIPLDSFNKYIKPIMDSMEVEN